MGAAQLSLKKSNRHSRLSCPCPSPLDGTHTNQKMDPELSDKFHDEFYKQTEEEQEEIYSTFSVV